MVYKKDWWQRSCKNNDRENIMRIILLLAVLTLTACSTTKEVCKEETKKECCSKNDQR